MQKTKNYNLRKPEPRDYYNVEDFNNNMDAIDEKLGAIDKKFNDVDETLEVLSDCDVTTTTETTLANSYKGALLIDEIGGVTEQDSTAGNQLFDASAVASSSISGINFVNNGDGSFTVSGTTKLVWAFVAKYLYNTVFSLLYKAPSSNV